MYRVVCFLLHACLIPKLRSLTFQVKLEMMPHIKGGFKKSPPWFQVTVIHFACEESSIDCERLIYFRLRDNLLTGAEREGRFLDTNGASESAGWSLHARSATPISKGDRWYRSLGWFVSKESEWSHTLCVWSFSLPTITQHGGEGDAR